MIEARNLQLFEIQGAVTVGTDILYLRTSEVEHASPGASLDGHAETAQANSAAIPLVPYAEEEDAASCEHPEAEQDGVVEVLTRSIANGENGVGGIHLLMKIGIDEAQESIHHPSSDREF